MNKVIDSLNKLYKEDGFQGVITDISDRLEYGNVTVHDDGLYCITTGGWSDDEHLLQCLTHILSQFGYYHFIGYLRGGAYYFSENKHDNEVIITRSCGLGEKVACDQCGECIIQYKEIEKEENGGLD